MASSIASPIPQPHLANRPMRKDVANLQLHDEGRATPLPLYEKTPSVPFTLTLQEEKNNPGQFQLVVNLDPEHKGPPDGSPLKPASSRKLIASLKEVPSLGYDVSPLYHTLKSSPPASPREERQGWSDLDAIHPDFLKKVVPDWKVTFSRNDSTASSQSRKLADIKARIKKSGKGFVVRLLKGSNTDADTNEVAEVHLGQNARVDQAEAQELEAQTPPVELDADTAANVIGEGGATDAQDTVFEIGTSSEPGIPNTDPPPASNRNSAIPHWLQQVADPSRRTSVLEEGFSDAETLLPDVRSIVDRLEEQSVLETMSLAGSVLPTRSGSMLSIVKTPTRGLSVVGPVRRVEKGNRVRTKGKTARLDLNRSGARKSLKRHSPRPSIVDIPIRGDSKQGKSTLPDSSYQISFHASSSDSSEASESSQHSGRELRAAKAKAKRHISAEELLQPSKPKSRLRLQTNVPQSTSADTSPVTRRKRSPRNHKPTSSSSSVSFAEPKHQAGASPIWAEVDPSDELREALDKAFAPVPEHDEKQAPTRESISIPRIEEPVSEGEVGDYSLPPEVELRSAPLMARSPLTTFWGLALSALAEKAFEGMYALRKRYGSEPPIAANHVRVRWTCTCGEPLYDDFIERRPGAARLLEAYLNRPRTHTPNSPSTRTSTTTSMSSLFDSASRASTLATPSSTYGGPSSWSKYDPSKYSPTRMRSNNPFSVRIGTYAEESWLLTCANEGRFTPKIVHLDVNTSRIKCDKDLALALREHYERLNRRWFRWARLRGLATIEFVQFEVHRNRFADIRASPSMPPTISLTNEKSPSQHPYTFEPVDLVPPVGSAYLLHLFKHPEDYDGELITYLRSPKRRERLEHGMGWGINLVEGFLAQKVWAVLMACFGVGSAVFAVLWTIREGDLQGAFGVAGWVVTLAGLVLGGLQAWLE